MKRVIMFFVCISALSLCAIRISNHPVSHIQANGDRIDLLLSGDEYYHYLTDNRGYTVLIDPKTDTAVYAELEDGKLISSNIAVGQADPVALGVEPGLRPGREELQRITQERDSNFGTRDGNGPTTGTINNIVIFVRFLDQLEYNEPIVNYDTALNSTTAASMRGFFLQESANQLTVNSTFYPAAQGGIVRSFQDGHARGYFSPWTSSNPIGYTSQIQGKERLWLMMQYAVNSVAASIPAGLDLDSDNDGSVDNITFICQGTVDTHADVLWPHHSYLFPYTPVMIGSLAVTDYNLQLSGFVHPGVLAHEFSHTMNFPDLYHYDNNLDPVGAWDTMASTSNPPQHHSAYMKQKYGAWFSSIPVITPSATATQYTLTAIDQNPFSCYKIASTRPNEFYVIEYRRDTGTYESGVPASGLIVYRILSSYSGSAMWGNPHGPPDEVYVYRPGINANSENGIIDWAALSSQSGRTDIYTGTDPSPWLYGDGSAQLPGNLVIMDIGAAGGTTISFRIKDSSPNRWLGTAGTEWTEALNWSHGTVPTVNDDVVIVNGYIYDPWIRVPGQACKSLTIKAGGELIISTGNLEVADNFSSYGNLSLNNNDASLYVYDNMYLMSGSQTSVSMSGAEIVVEENLQIGAGASTNWSTGYLEFSGSTASNLYCDSAVSIGNLRVEKTGSGSLTIAAANTAALTLEGGIYVNDGILNHAYAGTTIVKGNLHAYTGGSLAFYNGTISCEGSSSASIRIDTAGSYLHKLRIAKTGSSGISLSTSNTFVGNDLTIASGFLSCGANTLYVGGNWVNTAGPDSFYEGSGRVVMNGLNNQSLSSETFYILELNKSGQLLIPTGSNVNCTSYDWTAGTINVSGGNLVAADLADDGIFGSYILSSGNIDFTQDAVQYIDLRAATINVSGGVFTIRGGGGALWMAYQGTTNFSMSAGYFDVRDQDILISSSYTLNENITGGYIRTSGDFTCQRTDFNPAGGYIELWGGTNASLFVAAGSTLKTLLINKASTWEDPEFRTARGGQRIELTRANTVTAAGNLNISDFLIILNGIFDLSGRTVSVANDLQVMGQVKMSSGNLEIGDNVTWNGGAQVSGGTISCGGIWTFGPSSTAVLTGSTVILNNPYGSNLYNHSTLAGFGSLEINASEEDPVYGYGSSSGTALRVTGQLSLLGSVTLNLFESSCQAQSLSIAENCSMIVGDGGSLDVQSTLNLAGNLDVGPGSVTSHGYFIFPASGSMSINWGSFLNDCPWLEFRATFNLYGALNIDNGYFEIRHNNVSLAAHPTRIFTGAVLTFGRGFTAVQTGAYEPVGGSLVLSGNSSSTLYVAAPNYLSSLEIQKQSSARVSLGTTTNCQGDILINSGILDLNGQTLNLQGDLNVTGEVSLPEASNLRIQGGQSLNLMDGGILRATGSEMLPASIARLGAAGYYTLDVLDGSSISASYCNFANMDANGVYIHPGGNIDPAASFAHCTFQTGAPGGWLLRVDNSQNVTVDGVIFPTNNWSGAGNVKKTLNTGSLFFVNFSGGFSGQAFESDPFSRINWNALPPVPTPTIGYISTTNRIQLSWSYPVSVPQFRIYRSASPEGPWESAGTSTTTNWSQVVPGTKYFYKVTAEQ